MLTSRIYVPVPAQPETEDIFASAAGIFFTDDTQNSHGTPGQHVDYDSPCFGKLVLDIPQHPDVEEGRQLFAHYLWNAGVVAAEAIERASNDDYLYVDPDVFADWDRRYWDVTGSNVLELGAGTGLPSLIAALSHAHSITITDHPSSPSITNDTIQHNVARNLKIQPSATARTSTHIQIAGHVWGTTKFPSATHYGRLADPQPPQHSFTRILTTDCLWMRSQHANLIRTILNYLQDESDSAVQVPCALVVAGYHTGRSTVAAFFETATGSAWGVRDATPVNALDQDPKAGEIGADNNTDNDDDIRAKLRAASIFEIDVNCRRREWMPEWPGEDKDEAKRWCVCAVLVRA